MNEFVKAAYRDAAANSGGRLYPLPRASLLKSDFSKVFSTHLGHLIGGGRFEAEGLLVTGQSGSGKTTEIRSLIARFNASEAELPNGAHARFAECVLKGIGSWKDLGRSTAQAVGFPIGEKARLTQSEIWDIVVREAKLAGTIGIHFDEAQHIFREKKSADCLAVLDSFKTLMKSHDWPLMLIFSGVPELEGYMKAEPQLHRLLHRVQFNDVSLPDDYKTVHEIVGSYAVRSGVEVDADLMTQDFLDRLVAAGAYRWGVLIDITKRAIAAAQDEGAERLIRDHFTDWWVSKTKTARVATPFTHSDFRSMYRKDHLFLKALDS
ncbi:ATP-binding protein [Puniceibacterium sediminis]|uniref:AAA domain-containing protein n=1 Tax=Puniceibacterium sediminis TaxID=1608407 RepID=A0A238VLI0_9RHOB|nr:ATP-binding protein [Puniceibacterium sediminis]SNR35024.1 AAA domain-containing protein [Puniceibacterium sediminis]